MRSCKLEGNLIALKFSYDQHLVELIKDFPPYSRKWNNKDKKWLINLDVSNREFIAEKLKKFLDNNQFTIDATCLKYISQYIKLSNEKSVWNDAEEESFHESFEYDLAQDIDIDFLQHDLRPFQKAGVHYLTKHNKSFLADEMGLGKTVQAIATAVKLEAFPCLIICPVSLQKNWVREINKWTDIWFTTSELPNRNTNFNVIPYSKLNKYKDVLDTIPYKCIICDESHYLKNASAARTKLVKHFTKNTEYVYLLSGTPILNRPSELISQLEILNRMEDMGGWKYFVETYCAAYRDRFGLNISGAKNLDKLNQELRKKCYIRRQKKDVLKELPDKQRVIIDVELESMQDYKNSEQEVLIKIQEMKDAYESNAMLIPDAFDQMNLIECKSFLFSELNKPSPDVKLEIEKIKSKNKLISYAVEYFDRKAKNVENAEALMLLNKLRQKSGEGKIKSVEEWINNFMDNEEKLIVFADNISVQKDLIKRLQNYNPASVIGEMDGSERQNNVDKFQTDISCRIIVCSLQAAGVGITLTAASNVAFVQCGWTPGLHDQAEDRAHRIGQENAVTCYYLLAPNTIDTDIYELLESKREIVTNASQGKSDISSVIANIRKRQKQ